MTSDPMSFFNVLSTHSYWGHPIRVALVCDIEKPVTSGSLSISE